MNHSTLMWTSFAAVVTVAGFFLCLIPFFGPVFLFWLIGSVYVRSPVAQEGSKTAWLFLVSAVVAVFSLLWIPLDITKYGWVGFFAYAVFCCVAGTVAFLLASREKTKGGLKNGAERFS